MLRSTLTPPRPARPPRRVSISGRRKNAPSSALAEYSDSMRGASLDAAVDVVIAARNENNGRLHRDTMAGILNGMPLGFTRDMIYNRERKRRRVEEEILDARLVAEEIIHARLVEEGLVEEEILPAPSKKAGRPLGATNEAKRDREERENKAKTDAVQALLALWAVRESGKRSKKNELKLIIEAAKKKFNVEDLLIPESMIRDRASRGTVENPSGAGRVSPMAEIEPLLVTFVICMQRIGQPLNQTSFLELANSLIEGTPLEKKVLASKKGGKSGKANGIRYYSLFLQRHKEEIDSKCPRKFPADRTTWTTYSNIDSMYDMVYAVLVDAGVASRADSPQWTDKSGHPVETEAEAFGSLVEFIVDHPEYFLFVNELGKNTNQKDAGNRKQGGFVDKNTVGKQTCSATDHRFTILGFTALTGEPVMCVVIFQGARSELPLHTSQGIDIFADCNDNFGKGHFIPGGPECVFRGKTVPCYTTASPHGGITGEILMDLLKFMDGLELFPRTKNGPKPVLLLDGNNSHNSQFSLAFLQYINNLNTQWFVTVGLPYGTHVWQVGDSSEHNSSFNNAFYEARDILFDEKWKTGQPPTIVKTDIIPLVNCAWERSFARRESNKKAISTRGWNPLNRGCLKDPEVMATKPAPKETT